MKLAFITPTAYLNRFSKQGDFYLALAHLIDDNGENEYARFHRREAEQGKRVILDNGLFEGAQVTTDELLRRAAAVKAQTVCAPDVLYDSKGTIKRFKEFIKAKHETGMVFNVMGIPQADNPGDWWDCWQFFNMHEECSLVGLSILSIPASFGNATRREWPDEWAIENPITASRTYLIRQLYALSDLSGHRIKPCHMLGLGESYADIYEANYLLSRDIVSNDSSSAFVHGMHHVAYRDNGTWDGGKISEKLDFDIKFAYPQIVGGDVKYKAMMGTIQHNIDIAKRLANG